MNQPESYLTIRTGRASLSNWIKSKYPEFYKYLTDKYEGIDVKIALYMHYNGIDEIPLCSCGKRVKFHGYQYGFSKFCCPRCAGNDEEVQTKLKKTIDDKYGEEARIKFHKKGEETKKKKYGDPHYNNSSKSKQTCLDRYGVDNPMKSKTFQEKSKQTCLEKYGCEYFLNSNEYSIVREDCMQKAKHTCIEKYGYESAMQNESIKRKVNDTCLDRYGVKWNCMRPEAKNSRNYNSHPNTYFAQLLEMNSIDYTREFYISGKSYDFKVGNTLIEINPSPTHNINWNPYGGKIIDKTYHKEKTDLARSYSYNIVNVWDWDDIDKILYIIKPKQRIGARECFIKEVNKKCCKIFLDSYHIQSSCKSQSIRLGLFYKDKLIGIMTFGKPRYNKKCEYELLRLCYHPDYLVVGGAEKMFNYFIQTYQPENIISYCDNSKFGGNVYRKLGFVQSKESNPSRHWFNIKTHTHITDNLLRQRGFDQLFNTSFGKGSNNDNLMRDSGFVEIYDSGQSTWMWKK